MDESVGVRFYFLYWYTFSHDMAHIARENVQWRMPNHWVFGNKLVSNMTGAVNKGTCERDPGFRQSSLIIKLMQIIHDFAKQEFVLPWKHCINPDLMTS